LSRAVVLDTNVLVSARLKPGSPLASIIEAALLRKMPVQVCPAVVDEYRRVLSRPKFERLGPWEPWLDRFLMVAFRNPDPPSWPHSGPDPDDLVFLALAKAAGALLVTGNLADFPPRIRAGVTVLSPGDYLDQSSG
jgi:putative PIN family toxin of toxin-antitoxin system